LPSWPARGGGTEPSFGWKLFRLASASISVPSTETRSVESSAVTCSYVTHRGEEMYRYVACQQQVEPNPLHEVAFQADRVERVQQQGRSRCSGGIEVQPKGGWSASNTADRSASAA